MFKEYDTSIGKLRFFDGLPDEATIQKVYDNLDRSRAMHAFLDPLICICHSPGLPGAFKLPLILMWWSVLFRLLPVI